MVFFCTRTYSNQFPGEPVRHERTFGLDNKKQINLLVVSIRMKLHTWEAFQVNSLFGIPVL